MGRGLNRGITVTVSSALQNKVHSLFHINKSYMQEFSSCDV